MSLVTVVIVSWNTRELLLGCLETVRQEAARFERGELSVIVVDNASTDDSVAQVRKQFPEVQVLENDSNLGFARANNLGFKQSDSEFILMLNPDTELKPGAVERLVEFMRKSPRAGIAGSMLVSPDGELQMAAFPLPTPGRELWRLFHLDKLLWQRAEYPLKRWDHQNAHEVGAVQGASLMIRRQALSEVGPLDPQFYMYTEEVDLCQRMHLAGWAVYWVPQSRVLHFGGQSTRQARAEMFLELYRSKMQFIRKHYGWLGAAIYKAVLAAASTPRALAPELLGLGLEAESLAALRANYRSLLRALPSL